MEKLFTIVKSVEYGDYVVARRRFRAGKVIFQEDPILAAPDNDTATDDSDFVCIGCFRILPEVTVRCDLCLWPVCREECSKIHDHANLECPVFQSKGILPERKYLGFVKYVRVVKMRELYPVKYAKLFSLDSDFRNKWTTYQEIVHSCSQEISEFLNSVCGLTVPLGDIWDLYCILKINSFGIHWEESSDVVSHRGTALFQICSKFCHSDFPNLQFGCVKVTTNGMVSWKLQLATRTEIKKGDTLSIAYGSDGLTYGTGYRQIYQSGFPFDCLCPRCTDATECGTFFSSPKCPECNIGNMLADDPLNSLSSLWTCSMCSFVQAGEELEFQIGRADRLLRIWSEMATPETLHQVDIFIKDNSGKLLHENHFLLYRGILNWLHKSNFTGILMEDSRRSKNLFKRIMKRADRCLRLSSKMLSSKDMYEFEMLVADILAVYRFKCLNSRSIPTQVEPVRLNKRYLQRIVKHVSEAQKWIYIEPAYEHLENDKRSIDDLYVLLTARINLLSLEIELFDQELENLALTYNGLSFVCSSGE